jgi:hypothetical protein
VRLSRLQSNLGRGKIVTLGVTRGLPAVAPPVLLITFSISPLSWKTPSPGERPSPTLGLLCAPQAVSGRAVEYLTCFMEIFDFTFPTPAILANRFTQNSRNSSRSRATTRST